ncbi:hypothetical protein Cgig2_030452 [Carnegiea gigantea]|uniref:Uncharacterized protein n=1 Tax=Carnegiea gigantea TaxID=171969 RepID=A0A9Q1KMG6_9CARY|nr:hypothetical protein Cgig2_030452 [Carnegiea gigantea]
MRNQSDHAPILISTVAFSPPNGGPKPFSFQAAYYVAQCWEPNDMSDALRKLANQLSNWNRKVFGNLPHLGTDRRYIKADERIEDGGPRYLLNLEMKAGSNTERKPRLVAWATVTKPVLEGGLGIRPIRGLNWVSMATLGWRMIQEPDSLWARILKHKCCKGNQNLNTFKPGRNPSNAWKGICESKWILDKGIMHSIRNGHRTLF